MLKTILKALSASEIERIINMYCNEYDLITLHNECVTSCDSEDSSFRNACEIFRMDKDLNDSYAMGDDIYDIICSVECSVRDGRFNTNDRFFRWSCGWLESTDNIREWVSAYNIACAIQKGCAVDELNEILEERKDVI